MELHPLTFDVGSRTWSGPLPEMDSDRTLVLAIGAPAAMAMSDLKRAYPHSVVVGCGGINPSMTDLTVTITRFADTRLSTAVVRHLDPEGTAEAVLRALAPHGAEDLRAVLVLGAGAGIEDVVSHLRLLLPSVAAAGEQPDGADAWVMAGHADTDRSIVAIGLYGEALVVPDPPDTAPDLLLVTLQESDPTNDPDARLAVKTTTYDLRDRSWSDPLPIELDSPRTLVLVFGSPEFADNRAPLFELSAAFPRSRVLGCSGAGEFVGGDVRDGILAVAVARFVHTDVVLASADVPSPTEGREAGHRLAAALQRDDLRAVFVLSEGAKCDGTELVAGLREALPPGVRITGGLAGDGTRFRKTWLLFDGELRSGRVIAAGLCGDHVVVGHASRGGWEPFGPEHRVTRSHGHTVYELDERPALQVYQEDLGATAAELPGSALPFPLALRRPGAGDQDPVLFRTLLSVDERDGTLTFAGDVPEGTVATVMRAEWTHLVESAREAASASGSDPGEVESDQLAIAVSGVGRRSVLGARSTDELAAVGGGLPRAAIVGFYAYGELSPTGDGQTELQNQTMTVTTFAESPVALTRVPAAIRPAPGPATPPDPARTATILPPSVPPTAPLALSPLVGQGEVAREIPSGRALLVESFAYVTGLGWTRPTMPPLDSDRTLILAVGGTDPQHPDLVRSLRSRYPHSQLFGWSAPGEPRLSVTVARFTQTRLVPAMVPIDDPARSYDVGRRLGTLLVRLSGGPIRLVLVTARAGEVRGAELTRGLTDALGPVPIVGGLAGADDGHPWLSTGEDPVGRSVVAVGLVGDHLAVGHAVRGGVDPYPPERVVTRAVGNVLYELDGRPALAVLRSQLGPDMEGPPTGHWFGVWVTGTDPNEIRRVMVADEGTRSVALDQPVPTGARVHLVRETDPWLAAEARAAGVAARAATPNQLPAALTLAVGGSARRGASDAAPNARRDLSGVADGADPVSPVLAWTADEILTAITGLGAEGPVAVYTLAESPTPLPLPVGVTPSTAPTEVPESLPPGPRLPEPAIVAETTSRRLDAPSLPPLDAREEPLEDELTADTPRAPPPPPRVMTTPSAPPAVPFVAALPKTEPERPRKPTPGEGPTTAVTLAPLLPGEGDSRPTVVRAHDRTPAPVTSRASDATGVGRRVLGGVEVVSIGARITEAFPGEKLGKELSGTVIVDLGRVERITSFGVREWLSTLRGCRDRVESLYLIRCTEPFMNQLTMIRGFAGHGHVVSFYAPYVCQDCGTSYSALLDAERDRADLLAMTAPKTFCPRCGSPGTFDDEEGSYFSMLGQLAESVPPDIRRVLSALDPVVASDAIEKRVDQDVTRISVFVPVDGAVRWNQILDGVEGRLVIDFSRATSATAEGAENLERALRRAASEMESVAVIATPRLVATRLLSAANLPRIDVWSVMAEAFCPTCETLRTVLVAMSDQSLYLTRGLDPRMDCARCGTRLSFEPSRPLLRLVVLHGKPGDQTAEIPRPPPMFGSATEVLDDDPVPEATGRSRDSRPIVAASPALVPALATGTREGRRNLLTIAAVGVGSAMLGVGVAVLLVLIGLGVWRLVGGHPASPPQVADVTPISLLPPAWAEQPVSIDPHAVRVVGHATASPTEEAGLARARDDALGVLVNQVLADLVQSPVHRFVSNRVPARLGIDDEVRVSKRYLDQMGARATPQRIDRFTRDTPYGLEVWARYELSRQAYDEVLAHYGTTADVLGAQVAPFFPLLEATFHSSSEVVILSVDDNPAKKARVLPGELVRSLDEEAVKSVDQFVHDADDRWSSLRSGQSLVLQLEDNGATRDVTLTRSRRQP